MEEIHKELRYIETYQKAHQREIEKFIKQLNHKCNMKLIKFNN